MASLTKSWIQKHSKPTMILVLILLLGTILRFYDLGAESYWIDEMSTVIEGQQSIQQILESGRIDQPPAYYLPYHLWLRTFGTSEVSTRFFSVLFGIGSILLIYLVGRELFGPTVGLIGSFLLSISEYQIYYSQVSRFYSLFELATLLSLLFFILALKRNKILFFALYLLSSILMVYSHTYGVFVLSAQGLYILFSIKKLRTRVVAFLICQVLVLIAFVPYLLPLLSHEGNLEQTVLSNAGNLPVPTIYDVLRSLYHFIFSARRDRTWDGIIINYAVAGIFFIVCTLIYIIKRGKGNWIAAGKEVIPNLQDIPDLKDKLLLAFCWLLCPLLLPFILSFIVMPLYKDYYMISAAPAFYLLLAFAILSIRKLVPLFVTLGALAIMIVPGLGYYYATDIHEQWREAAAYVEENSSQNELIVFAPDTGIGIQKQSFYWYYQNSLPSCSLSSELIEPMDISTALSQCTSGYDHYWVIIPDYETVSYDDRYRSFFKSTDHSGMILKEKQFVGLLVYLFETAK